MEKLTVTDVGIKAKSKLEVYRVLTTEGGVYLPPAKEWNYQYIRDIVTGNKLVRHPIILYLVHKRKRRTMHYSSLFQRIINKRDMRMGWI